MFYTLTLKMQKKSSGQHLNHYNYFKKILIAFQKENNENPKSDYKRLYPAIFAIGDFVHYVFFSTSLDYLNRLQNFQSRAFHHLQIT